MKIWFVIILQGAFQFLRLYGYPDYIENACNKTGVKPVSTCFYIKFLFLINNY